MALWVFLRHGSTRANLEHWLSGWLDLPILEEGQREAAEAGRLLSRMGVGRVLASDLLRARQTLQGALVAAGWTVESGRLLASGSPVEVRETPDLRERDLGAWQGASLADLRAAGQSRTLVSWNGRPPGGESLRDVAVRAIRFLAAQPDEPTLVVSHGGTLRVVLGALDHDDRDAIGRQVMDNGALAVRELPPGRWGELLDEL